MFMFVDVLHRVVCRWCPVVANADGCGECMYPALVMQSVDPFGTQE